MAEMLVFRVCGDRQNFYVFSLYRNPDLGLGIGSAVRPCSKPICVPHSCLWVTWMAIIRNGWLLLPRTVMVLRPSILPLYQVVINWWKGPTPARGGTLDLLMTDVPDLVRVAVVAPLGCSDHSSLSIAISIAQAIPNLCVSKRVLLKHRVTWTAACDAIGGLPWRSIWSADNPVERLNVHLSLLVEFCSD